jgi:hypothetical protein
MHEAMRALSAQIFDVREEALGWLLLMPAGTRLCWHDEQAVVGVAGSEDFQTDRDATRLAWRMEYHFLREGAECDAPVRRHQYHLPVQREGES